MYNGQKVIDIHGHMSTQPQFRAYAYNMVALRTAAAGGDDALGAAVLGGGLDPDDKQRDSQRWQGWLGGAW